MYRLRRLFHRDRPPKPVQSYAQAGEDCILDYALRKLRIAQPTYLDIGAHHPTWLSNTYRLYMRGCQGVCIEPDPELCAYFQKARPRDTCLNAGIAFDQEEGERDFFLMAPSTLNTFSREEAEKNTRLHPYRVRSVERVRLLSINRVIEEHLGRTPDLVSLDVEGLDLQVLQTLDFRLHRPPTFCIETLAIDDDGTERKCAETQRFMLDHGYFLYADTWINTVFVDQIAWHAATARRAA